MTSKSQATDEKSGKQEKKKSRKLLVIIILVLLVGISGATLFVYKDSELVTKFTGNGNKEVKLQSAPLKEFIVNLSDSNYRRYLKITLVVEYKDKKTAEEIEKNNYKVRDSIINLISSKAVSDISDIVGKDKLKEDLIKEVNGNLKLGKVENVFWTDFVIQ